MEKVFFREEQRFNQWWIWLILLLMVAGSVIPLLMGLYTQLILGEPWGKNPGPDWGLVLNAVLVFLLLGAVLWLFSRMKLQTEIRVDGVWFRFPPLLRKWQNIRKEEIERFEVLRYRPIAEYGGWGIKKGSRKSGKAYNVSGNIGLRLHLKNGKVILLGTQRKEAIAYSMEKMMTGSHEIF